MHVPLNPGGIFVDGAAKHFRLKIRHPAKGFFPLLDGAFAPAKTAVGVYRLFREVERA